MNDWPEAWSDDNRGGRYGRGSGSAQPESARVMRQVRRGQPAPPGQAPYGQVPQQPRYADGGYDEYDSGYNTGQVYGGGRGGGDGHGPERPAPDWRRRIKWTAITLVTVLVVTTVATYFWADSKLNRDVDLSKVIERPEKGEGTNYLIVGSDSREGLSDEDKKRLRTGSSEGKRTDSMMILHTGNNGPTLISLPRDSNVEIPTFKGSESGKTYQGTGREVKLNAAYAEDGPELLVRTVEFNTGLHIDHYVEIGFAGFANIVDAAGGVEIDIPQDIKDTKSGADLKKGKQTLNGEEALAFVRTRYALAGSDLDAQEPAEVPVRPGQPGGDPEHRAQPVPPLPDHGRGPGLPDRRQGHGAVRPGRHVLVDEGCQRRRGHLDEHAAGRLPPAATCCGTRTRSSSWSSS